MKQISVEGEGSTLSTSEEANIQFSVTIIKRSQCKKLLGVLLIFDGKLYILKINSNLKLIALASVLLSSLING